MRAAGCRGAANGVLISDGALDGGDACPAAGLGSGGHVLRSVASPDGDVSAATAERGRRSEEVAPPLWQRKVRLPTVTTSRRSTAPGARGLRLVYEHAACALARSVAWPGAAEDVTQEVFLRLWRNPGRYDATRGSLRSFLLTMTHHLAVDAVRADVARRARDERHALRPDDLGPAEVDQQLLLADRRSTIDRALDHLSHAERVAITTAFYGGCTYREAALIIGVAEGTLKSRIRAGLRHLHEALSDPPERIADVLPSHG